MDIDLSVHLSEFRNLELKSDDKYIVVANIIIIIIIYKILITDNIFMDLNFACCPLNNENVMLNK